MVFNKLLRELKLMQGELLGMGERILASIEREGANTDISGVREQILANVKILYPVYEGNNRSADNQTKITTNDVTPYEIIVQGRKQGRQTAHVLSGDLAQPMIFIAGPIRESYEEALYGLLEITAYMLECEPAMQFQHAAKVLEFEGATIAVNSLCYDTDEILPGSRLVDWQERRRSQMGVNSFAGGGARSGV